MAMPPREPHHIISEAEAGDVGFLQVRRNQAKLRQFPPTATYDEIARWCRAYGPGIYQIVGYHYQNNLQLRGMATVEVENDEPVAYIGSPPPSSTDGGTIVKPVLDFLSKQQRQESSLVEKLEIERAAMRKEMAEERASLNKLAEKTQNTAFEQLLSFLANQRATENAAREHDEKLRVLREQEDRERRRQELENREIRHKEELDRIKTEADNRLVQMHALLEAQNKNERTIQEERLKLMREEMRIQFEQQRSQLESKLELSQRNDLPKGILEELFRRRLDQEYPEPSPIERLMDTWLQPLLQRIPPGILSVKPETPSALPPGINEDEIVI